MPGKHDLLVVGSGLLGRLVADSWRAEFPDSQIVERTVTRDHPELMLMEINPWPKKPLPLERFTYVVFCAPPPARSPDYIDDLQNAARSWNGLGSFLFISSSILYDVTDNNPCAEDGPIVPLERSPGTNVLIRAEKFAHETGGRVLRLASLYKADEGIHIHWLRKGIVDLRPDHMLNVIHYEDAASLIIAILKKTFHGRTFLGCDNHPLSRGQMMEIVNRCGKFKQKFDRFTGTDDPLGKKLNNSKTRAEFGWKPKYTCFAKTLALYK